MFITCKKQIITDNNKFAILAEQREKAGIVDARRAIHIFYDENNPFSCKVIQINISTTKGTHVLFDKTFMNRHNGCLSFIAVYTYDCKLNTAYKTLKEKFLYGSLSIISAKRNDRETDFDNNHTRNEFPQLHSKIFSNYKISDNIDSRVLIHPKFYTQEHEYQVTNDCDFGGINNEIFDLNITGNDIVDDITEIYKQSHLMFDSVNENISNNNYLNRKMSINTINAISAEDSIKELNYILGCDSLISGGVFVYDSQMEMNFKNTAILCKKYITKETALVELESFLSTIEVIGKSIESECGSIRMMYHPSLLGSKCRIIYKDYNNTTSDSGLKNSLSSKDSSTEVTETIGECIDHDDSLFCHEAIYGYEGIRYPELEKERLISYCE